jgi:hypothetical protein
MLTCGDTIGEYWTLVLAACAASPALPPTLGQAAGSMDTGANEVDLLACRTGIPTDNQTDV